MYAFSFPWYITNKSTVTNKVKFTTNKKILQSKDNLLLYSIALMEPFCFHPETALLKLHNYQRVST